MSDLFQKEGMHEIKKGHPNGQPFFGLETETGDLIRENDPIIHLFLFNFYG